MHSGKKEKKKPRPSNRKQASNTMCCGGNTCLHPLQDNCAGGVVRWGRNVMQINCLVGAAGGGH